MSEQIKVNPAENVPLPGTSNTIEQPATPERFSPDEGVSASQPNDVNSVPTTSTEAVVGVVSPEAQRIADIERILEEDLGELYAKLPAQDQEKFRTTGETTARQINTLLSSATLQLKKIVDAIRNWLSIIPGVSKYFLEQEAKIKADRLVKLHDRH